jgi:1,4-dihydroxy-2-naphthoyl-CoA synthase
MRKEFERAHLTTHGSVALVTLNHPEAMNAASVKMLKGLTAALDHIERDGNFRAIVMTGEAAASAPAPTSLRSPRNRRRRRAWGRRSRPPTIPSCAACAT